MLLATLALSTNFGNNRIIPDFCVNTAFNYTFNPLLNLPTKFSTTMNLISIFYNTTGALVPSVLLTCRLFNNIKLRLVTLNYNIYCVLSNARNLCDDRLFIARGLLSRCARD